MRWLKWLVRAAVGLALAAAVGVGWLLGTESGLRWALARQLNSRRLRSSSRGRAAR